MIIIPAIDILRDKVVRLYRGDYNKPTFYDISPVDFALRLDQSGFKYLHVVDLEGARTGVSHLYSLVNKICTLTSLRVDVGGGIRTTDTAKRFLEAGVMAINVGSAIVKNPGFLTELMMTIPSDKIIFSADIQNNLLKVSGWEENSYKSIHDVLKALIPKGLKYISCTDINRDGTLGGINAKMYSGFISLYPELHWIAGGGVSCKEDLINLKEAGCFGCIVGRAIYEKEGFLEEIAALC